MTKYKAGDSVYLILSHTSLLKTRSRKFKFIYIGSFAVYKVIDIFQYILMDIKDKILNGIFNFNRLKQAYVRSTKIKQIH